MAWFKRSTENIQTPVPSSRVAEEGWSKCDNCGEPLHRNQIVNNFYSCTKCGLPLRITSREYIDLLLDAKSFKEADRKMRSNDPLKFADTKKYADRIKQTIDSTGLYDAVRCGMGTIEGIPVSVAVMDFGFIGGSMGSVVGEKIARSIDRALKNKCALVIVATSGGARMMEGAFSLMQMAKTSAKLTQLAEAKLPYIAILLDPTTGGVTASFAMLGDVILAEPKALIGFAGPRVIRQTIGKDLPEGFQRSEFLLEKGFLDMIVERRQMKETVARVLRFLKDA